MYFHDPLVLCLLPVALLVVLYCRFKSRPDGIPFPDSQVLSSIPATPKVRLLRALPVLRAAALCLTIVALARPQLVLEERRDEKEGIDMVLAVDISPSMLAEDFVVGGARINRLEAAKTAIRDFIKGRDGDRIGMVTFAANAYVVAPLTLDHEWLIGGLGRLEPGTAEDSTSVGAGLLSALSGLRDSKSREKAVILLTDGRDNSGDVAPSAAASAAKALGVRVYTIGAGTTRPAPFPVADVFGGKSYRHLPLDLDEETLAGIAGATKGRYFRVTDTDAMKRVYDEIGALEKTKREVKVYYHRKELFHLFFIPALSILLLESVAAMTVVRTVPRDV